MYKRDFIYMVRPGEPVTKVSTDPKTLTEHLASGWSQCAPPEVPEVNKEQGSAS